MDLKKLFEKLSNKDNDKNTTDKNTIGNLLILLLVGVLIVITVSFFKTSNAFSIQNLKDNQNTVGNNGNRGNGGNSVQQQTSTSNNTDSDYEASVQQKLKDTLEKIDGVGKVEVMINFESGEEQVPAVNINDSTSTTEEKDTEGGTRNTTQKNNGSTVVITNDGDKSEPLIVKTYKPKVSGVVVVAEGAEDKLTALRITKAVVDLFSITDDKVNVYPMKK